MGIEVWVPTNVVRPPERYVPSVGFVNVMSPLVGFVEPIRYTPPDLGRRTGEFKPSKKKKEKHGVLGGGKPVVVFEGYHRIWVIEPRS